MSLGNNRAHRLYALRIRDRVWSQFVNGEKKTMLRGKSILMKQPGEVHTVIEVIQKKRVRYLRFGQGGGWQGALDLDDNHSTFAYQQAFATLVRTLTRVDSFLSIGVGTGTALRSVAEHFPDAELTGVDVDQKVIDAAIGFFYAPSHERAQYFATDGVQYLEQVNTKFDLIFVDAYMKDRVDVKTLDPAFAYDLYQALSDDGIAVCNLIVAQPILGRHLGFLRAARQLFEQVWLLPVGPPIRHIDQNTLAVFCKDKRRVRNWKSRLGRDSETLLLRRLLWSLRLREF
jgi:spermidine synthase